MMMDEAGAKALAQKILGLSQAESCTVAIDGGDDRHIRFAQNRATTNGAPSSRSVTVESHFGKRSGSASGTDLSDDGLLALVRAAEDVAQRAPENPEFMPPLGPQTYGPTAGFADATASTTPAQLADAVAPVMKAAAAKNLQASGFLDVGTGFSAFATSQGAAHRQRAHAGRHRLRLGGHDACRFHEARRGRARLRRDRQGAALAKPDSARAGNIYRVARALGGLRSHRHPHRRRVRPALGG
jgi:predicted Zn-dependent protease